MYEARLLASCRLPQEQPAHTKERPRLHCCGLPRCADYGLSATLRRH